MMMRNTKGLTLIQMDFPMSNKKTSVTIKAVALMLNVNEQTLEENLYLLQLIDKCKKHDHKEDLEELRATYAHKHSIVDLILHGRKDLDVQ